MQISIAAPEFRPVTLVIETQDEWDQLRAIVDAVAKNKINHLGQVRDAACKLDRMMANYEPE